MVWLQQTSKSKVRRENIRYPKVVAHLWRIAAQTKSYWSAVSIAVHAVVKICAVGGW